MKRHGPQSRIILGSLAFVALMTVVASPVLGQEPTDTTVPAESTTLPAEQIDPVVPVEPPVEAAATLDWTYRYLIPTGLVLAVVVILITSIRYFTNVVRRRYRIIEE
jgi:hypothetical protein